MTPRLIIFDVDGTLIDSQHIIVSCMQAAFETCGLPPPPADRALGVVGLSLEEAMADLVPDVSPAMSAALSDAYRDGFVASRARGEEAPLYPGALSCLKALAAVPEVVLGIATGKTRRGVDHSVASHRLHGLFTTIQTADGHPSKPHPSMVQAAMAETGIDPGATCMIGDTSFDMDMGRAAGVRTIGVSWGYHARDRLGAADRVVDDFAALRAAVLPAGGDR